MNNNNDDNSLLVVEVVSNDDGHSADSRNVDGRRADGGGNNGSAGGNRRSDMPREIFIPAQPPRGPVIDLMDSSSSSTPSRDSNQEFDIPAGDDLAGTAIGRDFPVGGNLRSDIPAGNIRGDIPGEEVLPRRRDLAGGNLRGDIPAEEVLPRRREIIIPAQPPRDPVEADPLEQAQVPSGGVNDLMDSSSSTSSRVSPWKSGDWCWLIPEKK